MSRNASFECIVVVSTDGVRFEAVAEGRPPLPPPPPTPPLPAMPPATPPIPPRPLPTFVPTTPPDPPLLPRAIMATLNSEKGMVSKKLPMGCMESNGLYNIPAP